MGKTTYRHKRDEFCIFQSTQQRHKLPGRLGADPQITLSGCAALRSRNNTHSTIIQLIQRTHNVNRERQLYKNISNYFCFR